MKVEIGGKRLGNNNKMSVEYRNFERSTHDLSRPVRTTMSPGTLVPICVEPTLNGDTFDIDIESIIRTMPTVGPLFGSFKLQVDVFSVPMRLYNADLHMNLSGIGNQMDKVYFPKMSIRGYNPVLDPTGKNGQFRQNTLMAYLGNRGMNTPSEDVVEYFMTKNAIPFLAYWDIVKQYYSNQQEEIGYYIGAKTANRWTTNKMRLVLSNTAQSEITIDTTQGGGSTGMSYSQQVKNIIFFAAPNATPFEDLTVDVKYNDEMFYEVALSKFGWTSVDKVNKTMWFTPYNNNDFFWITKVYQYEETKMNHDIVLYEYPLSLVDNMKKIILKTDGRQQVIINDLFDNFEDSAYMYRDALINLQCSQNGLAIKTYLSDQYNNWLNTDWIDGNNGIKELTSITVTNGKFTLDELNIKKKVYDVLNRIAISGGTYYDWMEASWSEKVTRMNETPIFMGGMSREIVFEEVVSTSEANPSQPLGSLAGKGTQSRNMKGGHVTIKTVEPSFIMIIASITPRVDYSQGNKWWTNLDNMNQLHKPGLDGIGFQELITEQMHSATSGYNLNLGIPVHYSIGKQPAWLNYMTATPEVYGDFAEDLMFMVLNRRYETHVEGGQMKIKDLTTYIDPKKYNYLFANTKLDATNFWCQFGLKIIARRKMSAKIMPNL